MPTPTHHSVTRNDHSRSPPVCYFNREANNGCVNVVRKRYHNATRSGQPNNNNYFSLQLDKYQTPSPGEMNRNGYNPPFSVYRNKIETSSQIQSNSSPFVQNDPAEANCDREDNDDESNDEILVESFTNLNNRSFEIPICVERTDNYGLRASAKSSPQASMKSAASSSAKTKLHTSLNESYGFLFNSDKRRELFNRPKQALIRKVKYGSSNVNNNATNVNASPGLRNGAPRMDDIICLAEGARSVNDDWGYRQSQPSVNRKQFSPCLNSRGEKKQVQLVKLELNAGNRNDNCLKLLDDFLKEFD
jgi:hypothetical protein